MSTEKPPTIKDQIESIGMMIADLESSMHARIDAVEERFTAAVEDARASQRKTVDAYEKQSYRKQELESELTFLREQMTGVLMRVRKLDEPNIGPGY